MLSFFPQILDEILNLIESVSEGFLPTLSSNRTAVSSISTNWLVNGSLVDCSSLHRRRK